MKKNIALLSLLAGLILFVTLESCTDDIGPVSQCNNCTTDFPYSTDGSDTCYATQAACEDAEGVGCFICL